MTLDSLYGLDGIRMLDLYAGSGAVGLEALSRGAARAVLVESDPKAVKTIRENARTLGLDGAEVVADRVERFLAKGPGGPRGPGAERESGAGRSAEVGAFDIVFADPPYAVSAEEVTRVLESLRDNGWLIEGALVAFERETRGKALVWPDGFAEERVRRYGEASVWYGRAAGESLDRS